MGFVDKGKDFLTCRRVEFLLIREKIFSPVDKNKLVITNLLG